MAGCFKKVDYRKNIQGYRPIYDDVATLDTIQFRSSQPVVHPGKIVTKDQYIFQLEDGIGIHIIDAGIPAQAKRVGFIKVSGCQDLALNSHYLYTNHLADLVAIDIADYTHPMVANRSVFAFNISDHSAVPPEAGYFECPDITKGKVVGWYLDTIPEPGCRY
jgi:hypothetical protein